MHHIRNTSPRTGASVTIDNAPASGMQQPVGQIAEPGTGPVVPVRLNERSVQRRAGENIDQITVREGRPALATVPKLVIDFKEKKPASCPGKKLDVASRENEARLSAWDESAAQVEPGDAATYQELETLRGTVNAGEMAQLLALLKRWELSHGPLLARPDGVELLTELFRTAVTSNRGGITNYLLETYGKVSQPGHGENGVGDGSTVSSQFWLDELDTLVEQDAAKDFCLIQTFREKPALEPWSQPTGTSPEDMDRTIEILGRFLGKIEKNNLFTWIPAFHSTEETGKLVGWKQFCGPSVRKVNPLLFSRVALEIANIVHTSKQFSYCTQYEGMPREKQLLMLVATQLTNVKEHIADYEYIMSGFSPAMRKELDKRTIQQAIGIASMAESIIQKFWIDFFEERSFDATCLALTDCRFSTDKKRLHQDLLNATGMSGSIVNLLVDSWAQAAERCKGGRPSRPIPAAATFEEIGLLFDRARMAAIGPEFIRILKRNKGAYEFVQAMRREETTILKVYDPYKRMYQSFIRYRDIQLDILQQLVEREFAEDA